VESEVAVDSLVRIEGFQFVLNEKLCCYVKVNYNNLAENEREEKIHASDDSAGVDLSDENKG
jgi:hypothetical protein